MVTGGTTGADEADDGTSGRLDSWKDVAAYLKRDVSTVQRWERREGLPIHRHLHDKLGSIYAYRHELDAWQRGRSPRQPSPPDSGTLDTPIEQDGSAAAAGTPGGENTTTPAMLPRNIVGGRRWRLAPMAVVASLAGIAVTLAIFTTIRGRSVDSSPRITSLVVLLLANLSGDSSQDYLAAGLTEELIGRLARLQSLRVVSRTTAASFQGRPASVREIARALGVDAVVEGAGRREAGRVRISVQLIHAPTDTLRKGQRHQLGWRVLPGHCDNYVLLVVEHICHRRACRAARQLCFPNYVAGLLIEGPEHLPSSPHGRPWHTPTATFAKEDQRLRDESGCTARLTERR